MQVEVCVQEWAEDSAETEDGSQPTTSVGLSPTISTGTWELWFQQWMGVLQPDLSPIQAYELSLRLTDDREIQALNQQYRQQDQPTDVLAFAALEDINPPAAELLSSLPLYLGDIVISIETAQRQAKSQGHALETELAWLAAHGLLHLLGWDHPDENSLSQMLTQQQVLLSTVGLRVQTS
ncbi:MAG: rRNA maturation RNase YbeY [Kovacikia sp.]